MHMYNYAKNDENAFKMNIHEEHTCIYTHVQPCKES